VYGQNGVACSSLPPDVVCSCRKQATVIRFKIMELFVHFVDLFVHKTERPPQGLSTTGSRVSLGGG
jgi:hypothetical protein